MQGKNLTGGWSQVKAVDSYRIFIDFNTVLLMLLYLMRNAPRISLKTNIIVRSFGYQDSFDSGGLEIIVTTGKTNFARDAFLWLTGRETEEYSPMVRA